MSPMTPMTPMTPNVHSNLLNLTPPNSAFINNNNNNKLFNFFPDHRTPTEQAQFDLTSGIRIRIDGLDTKTITNEEYNDDYYVDDDFDECYNNDDELNHNNNNNK